MGKIRSIRRAVMLTTCTTATVFGIGGGCSPEALIAEAVTGTIVAAVSDGVLTLLDFILPVVPAV